MYSNTDPVIADTAPISPARRAFFGRAVTVMAGVAGSFSGIAEVAEAHNPSADNEVVSEKTRQTMAWQIRTDAARAERQLSLVEHLSNGDESRYPNKIANFSKGLPHNALGEVKIEAWISLIRALTSGDPEDFERIQTGGSSRFVNPQAGLAFAMQGPDSHALTQKPAPAFSSAEQASEAGENYWMSLVRDVSFSDYPSQVLTEMAAGDLSKFSDFRGPKASGRVTPATLFRGLTPGDVTGPYISQFLWQDTPFGAETIDRKMKTAIAGMDYLTSYSDWLAIQNGAAAGSNLFDPTPRYIRNGRDLSQWVHMDVLFQAYFNALLILFRLGAPIDAGNPYKTSSTQIGFGTLGDPYIASVLCGVAREALKAVWYQKWFVHRRLRPEVFGGRIHNHKTSPFQYPIHSDILNSPVLEQVRSRYGTFLMPQAYPEGSPLHPSYGAGHATVAGACVTVLKAFFDESFIIPSPAVAAGDGSRLLPYSGPSLTVGGELNKLASNVAFGRNFAGIHWRSDAIESLKLGEELAIRYLKEEGACFNEDFDGYSLTKFDGTFVVV